MLSTRVRAVTVALLMLIAGVLPGTSAQAQRVALDSVTVGDTALLHAVRIRDGSLLVGRIIALASDSVRMELRGGGALVLPRTAIVSVDQFGQERFREGEYWFENPHASRLLVSSTAFPLAAGTGYYANSWLLFHTFAAGLTDRFSIGGGFSYIPGIDLGDNLFYLLPKLTVIDEPRAKFALGGLLGILPLGGDNTHSIGFLYGVGSFGTADSHLSLGLGWGYAEGDFADRPLIMVGGQARGSRRVAFISENLFVPTDDTFEGAFSAGLRFLGEGVSVDLALVRPTDGDVVLPWLGFAFRFR